MIDVCCMCVCVCVCVFAVCDRFVIFPRSLLAEEGATSSDEEQEVPASQSPSKPQTTAKERNAAAKAMILRKAAKIVLFIINGLFETYR